MLFFHGCGMGGVLNSFRGIGSLAETLIFWLNPVDGLLCKYFSDFVTLLLQKIIDYMSDFFYPTKNHVRLFTWTGFQISVFPNS